MNNTQQPVQNEITNLLEINKCSCMNESKVGSFLQILNGQSNFTVISMVDPQLLFQLSFRQYVNITHIEFETTDTISCPKNIKLFSEKTNIGFEEASELKPTEIINLHSTVTSHKVQLKNRSAWNKTSTVQLFVENNHGSENTEIKNIKIYGSTVGAMDVSKIKNTCCC